MHFFIFLTGINKQIAVDAAYSPVVSSDEPRGVGLPLDPHGNTMLSCLSSGYLCPLSDTANHSDAALPDPGTSQHLQQALKSSVWGLLLYCDFCLFYLSAEEVLATASELEDTHVVCVLDLCHLGGDDVEILVSKVYRVTEVSLE